MPTNSSPWFEAVAAVSLWSFASASLAYRLWIVKDTNTGTQQDRLQLKTSDKSSPLPDSSARVGCWEGILNRICSFGCPIFLLEPNILLFAFGAVCCSLFLKNCNRTNRRTTEWLVWGSGLMAIRRALQQQLQNDELNDGNVDTLQSKQNQPIDSSWWPLLYVVLFPAPTPGPKDSQQQGPLLMACLWLSWNSIQDNHAMGNSRQGMDESIPRSETLRERKLRDTSTHVDSRHQQGNDQEPRQILNLPPSFPKDKPPEFSFPDFDSEKHAKALERKTIGATESTTRIGDSAGATSVSTTKKNKRFLELLVHNVSHTDFVLGLSTPCKATTTTMSHESKVFESATMFNESSKAKGPNHGDRGNDDNHFCLCRPRFSFFDHYCRAVRNNLTKKEKIVSFPRYQRSVDDPRYLILSQPNGVPIPTGLALCGKPPVMADLGEVRVRGKDHIKVFQNGEAQTYDNENGSSKAKVSVSHAFFPLLASLLPRWETSVEQKYRVPGVKRVLILVTGVGTPRNWAHSLKGNSTQTCADLMENFVHHVDPNLVVVKIHSETNIFRYDENLVFVQQELMPVINAYRDAHACGLPYPDELQGKLGEKSGHDFDVNWRQTLSVTLSFADGSPARTYAIQAGLRQYKPTFFHFWQLKTFWHESKIVDDDIEVYSFEAMDVAPAVDVQHIADKQLKMVVDEMVRFKDEMIRTLKNSQNDIRKFWLRKTQKPVLAVLLVQIPDGKNKPMLYRGTNMEVSMPTGSLCAERNVIGTALADNPDLKREHIKIVAVLSVPPASPEDQTTSAASSISAVVGGVDDAGAASLVGMKRVNSAASFGASTLAGSFSDLNFVGDRKISIGSETDDWAGSAGMSQHQHSKLEITFGADTGVRKDSTPFGRCSSFPTIPGPAKDDGTTPVRRISLYPSSHASSNSIARHPSPAFAPAESGKTTTQRRASSKRRTLVVVQSDRDLNPLDPCGACNEWLKKIAECNPYFQVVTFTDVNCNGVYCRSLPG